MGLRKSIDELKENFDILKGCGKKKLVQAESEEHEKALFAQGVPHISVHGHRYTKGKDGKLVKQEAAQKSVDDNMDLNKAGKGEGSKGGKVIGHTKSGKPIYENANHPAHKNFTMNDHDDARKMHIAKMEGTKQSEKKDNHWEQANSHYSAMNKMEHKKEKHQTAAKLTGKGGASLAQARKVLNDLKTKKSFNFKIDIKKAKEKLKGGRADGKPDSRYDKKALKEGTEDELKDHGGGKQVAKEITKDHLEKYGPEYIKKLAEMEKKIKKKK